MSAQDLSPSASGPLPAANLEALRALLDRVEAATGPDRSLSVAIWYAFHPDREELWALSGLNAQRELHREKTLKQEVLASPRDYGWRASDQDYTASLDAVLALVGRVLPGAICGVEGIGSDRPDARVITETDGDEVVTQYEADAKTAPLALLAALLRAKLNAETGAETNG